MCEERECVSAETGRRVTCRKMGPRRRWKKEQKTREKAREEMERLKGKETVVVRDSLIIS